MNENEEVKEKKNWKKESKSIFIIITLVLAFRSSFFEPFKIPTGSMIPTLSIGDFILVNKFTYGFKVPFSDWFTDPVYITGPKKPQTGDVVVFKYPKDHSLNYIKRVIGTPGDTVQMIDRVIYINDKPVQTTVVDGKKYTEDMVEKYQNYNFKFFKTETGEATHITQIDLDNAYDQLMNFPQIVIPDGKYFVMGDNRDNSSDSRFWGFVPFENIKGKAILIWFSMEVPMPWSPVEDKFKFRPHKIGELID